MTGVKSNFLSLTATQGGSVAFENGKLGTIVGIGWGLRAGPCQERFIAYSWEGNNSQEGLGTELVSNEEGPGDKQIGGTAVGPYLEQNKDSNSEIGSRTVLQTGAGTSLETGAKIAQNNVL